MTQRQYWRNGWDNVIAVADANGEPGAPWDTGVRNYVYDVDLMAWVAETQASGGGTGTSDATAANQVTGNGSTSSIDGKTPSLVSGRTPVDGSGVTQPVSGAFYQATQPVSGSFFQTTQPISIAATVPVSGPLTDTQLRATPVPVSGTVATGGLTDTQLRASAVPVSSSTLASASKQDTMIAGLQALNSLTPSIYDYIGLGYTGDNLTSVLYKLGGSGGTLVSTLTLAYSSSILQSVTKT